MRVRITAPKEDEGFGKYAGWTGTQTKKLIGKREIRLDGTDEVVVFPASLVEEIKEESKEEISSTLVVTEEDFKKCKPLQSAVKDAELKPFAILKLDHKSHEPYRYIADICTDLLYRKVKLDFRFAIAVLAVESLGYGDLLFGLRAAEALGRSFPAATIWLVSNQEGAKKIVGLGGDEEYQVKVLDSTAYASLVREKKLPPPSQIVMGPVTNMVAVPELSNVRKVAPEAVLIKINEYGFNRREPKSRAGQPHHAYSGVCMNELGIFFDPRLGVKHQKGNLENVSKIKDKALREALQQNCGSGCRLYLCYVHKEESLVRFVNTVLLLEALGSKDAGTDIDIVVARSGRIKKPKDEILKLHDLYTVHFTDVLAVSDDGVEHLYKQEAPVEISVALNKSSTTLDSPPRRRLRFLLWPISHVDIVTLHTACEPFMYATGDQSATEALSAGKLLVYEIFEHKKDWFESLCWAWEQLFGNQLLRMMAEVKPATLAKVLVDPDLAEMFAKFATFLREFRDLGPRLGLRVTRCLMRSCSPELMLADERYFTSLLNYEKEDEGARSNLLECIKSADKAVSEKIAL